MSVDLDEAGAVTVRNSKNPSQVHIFKEVQ